MTAEYTPVDAASNAEPIGATAGDDDERTTRDALMDAALEQFTTKGVLAGLNLREVADAVGITPANIYHYFGSRRGLLRVALAREAAKLSVPVAAAAELGFVERRMFMFDVIADARFLTLTSLLAIDGDPAYEPLPFLDATRQRYDDMVSVGELPADLDIDATHLITLATSIGVAIYADAAARQLGVTTEEIHSRTRAVFERMLDQLVAPD